MKKLISKVVIVLMFGVVSAGAVVVPAIHTVYAAEQTDNNPPADNGNKDTNCHDGNMDNMDMKHEHMNQN